jgi:beta-lactam-binding protein with PASTA domain
LKANIDGALIYSCTLDFLSDPPRRSEAQTHFTTEALPTVPNVVGKTEADAIAALVEAGYSDYAVESAGEPLLGDLFSLSGTVSRQSPRGGAAAEHGTTITIYVYD